MECAKHKHKILQRQDLHSSSKRMAYMEGTSHIWRWQDLQNKKNHFFFSMISSTPGNRSEKKKQKKTKKTKLVM
jgi:hypothetical protein